MKQSEKFAKIFAKINVFRKYWALNTFKSSLKKVISDIKELTEIKYI